MADEVYEGAIGIDLGKIRVFFPNFEDCGWGAWFSLCQNLQKSRNSSSISITNANPSTARRNHILLCCCIRGNQCWDQYVFLFSREIDFANRASTTEILYWSISPVANEQGSFTTPSFVSFTDKERLIGESAKNNAAMNPKNTIFDIKSVSRLSRRQQGTNETTGVWSEEDSMIPTPQRYLHDFISSRFSCIKYVGFCNRNPSIFSRMPCIN